MPKPTRCSECHWWHAANLRDAYAGKCLCHESDHYQATRLANAPACEKGKSK